MKFYGHNFNRLLSTFSVWGRAIRLNAPELCLRFLRQSTVKIYGNAPEGAKDRYSPAECTGIKKNKIEGSPGLAHVSTSYVERQNLTMRMHVRRFTRLTNAFSKKFKSHLHMVAPYTVFYNFCKIHKTLRVMPAMEAELSDTVRDFEWLGS